MNQNTQNDEAPRWAIVELMGHVRYGGLVSKDTMLGTAMLRIDVPVSETEFATQLINPASLYRLTFTTEELARLAAKSGQQKPISEWEIKDSQQPALPENQSHHWHDEDRNFES